MLIDVMTSEVTAHYITAIVEGACGIAVLYASYRIASLKLWIKDTVTTAIKENCAGKIEFEAHARADEVFQKTLMADITEKRADYKKQHEDHYDHANKTEIHQPSMPSSLLQEKFENVKNQVADVKQRVDRLTTIVEAKLH